MKTSNWGFALLAAGAIILGGCKRAQPVTEASPEYYGVKVELDKLDTDFTNAPPEVQTHVAMVKHDFRYSQFSQALAELAALAGSPDLTPAQKKLVEELGDQTKQVIAKAPAAPAQ